MARPDQGAANRQYYRRNRDREIARVRIRQHATLEFLRHQRRVSCSDCGGAYEPFQLDFDHRDPEVKSFRLTAGRAMLKSRADIIAEVAKCDVVCANCHRIRTQARHTGKMATRYRVGTSRYIERKRANWRDHARLLDDLRNVPCEDCGQRFPPCAMDFDHRDPVSKSQAVTRMIGRAGAVRILDEVAKCDIVCANCHRARTYRRRSETVIQRE